MFLLSSDDKVDIPRAAGDWPEPLQRIADVCRDRPINGRSSLSFRRHAHRLEEVILAKWQAGSQGGALIPRTEFVTAGYFVVKGEPGNDEVVWPRGWVTPKGMDYLASRMPPEIMIDPTTSPDGLPLFSRAEH